MILTVAITEVLLIWKWGQTAPRCPRGPGVCRNSPPAAQGPWSRCWRSSWSSQLASPSRTESSTSGSWSPSLRGTCGPPGRASAPPPRPRWSWWGWAGPRLTVCHCVGCVVVLVHARVTVQDWELNTVHTDTGPGRAGPPHTARHGGAISHWPLSTGEWGGHNTGARWKMKQVD